jgi:hypothetical protein
MPIAPVPADNHRQAHDHDLKAKRAYTATIYPAMGGLDKTRFSRYKVLLYLCDEAFEMADRHHLDEARLHYLVQLKPQDQICLLSEFYPLWFWLELGTLAYHKFLRLMEYGGSQMSYGRRKSEIDSKSILLGEKIQ